MAEQKVADDDSKTPDDFVQIFLMNIELKKANGLMKADVFGKSDPYCVVNALGQTYTTKTIMKNYDPIWNESTQICTFEDPKKLIFDVFDWDKGTQDDNIGHTELSLNGFFNEGNAGFNGELKLSGGKKVKGTITVSVKCRKLLPVKLENDGKRLKKETEQQVIDMDNINDNINKLKSENNDLENKNSDLVENIQELRGSVNATTDEIEEFKKQNIELETQISELEKEKSTKEDELNKIKKELDDKIKEFNKTENELSKNNNELSNLKMQYSNLEKEIEDKKIAIENEKKQKAIKKDEPKVEDKAATPLVGGGGNTGKTDNQLTNLNDGKEKSQCCCTIL